jgi:hypothetical protein
MAYGVIHEPVNQTEAFDWKTYGNFAVSGLWPFVLSSSARDGVGDKREKAGSSVITANKVTRSKRCLQQGREFGVSDWTELNSFCQTPTVRNSQYTKEKEALWGAPL